MRPSACAGPVIPLVSFLRTYSPRWKTNAFAFRQPGDSPSHLVFIVLRVTTRVSILFAPPLSSLNVQFQSAGALPPCSSDIYAFPANQEFRLPLLYFQVYTVSKASPGVGPGFHSDLIQRYAPFTPINPDNACPSITAAAGT